MPDRIRTGELAKRLGISRQRVCDLAREGKLTRSADGLWDPEAAARQLGRNLDPQQPPKARVEPEAGPGEPDPLGGRSSHEIFNRARAAKELAIAKSMQLNLKHREGTLLDEDDVARTWTSRLTAFKNRLLLVPDKLAPKVAVCANVLECREMIYSEVVGLLEVLSDTRADDAA